MSAALALARADGGREPADVLRWRADDGSLLDPVLPPFAPPDPAGRGVWRYRAAMGLGDLDPLWLGEGETPLVPANIAGLDVHAKLEYLQPTGSYKDRGAAVLAAALAAAGARGAVEDSSGNAGAALAAYCARAGIALQLFVPAWAADGMKVRQARAFGAIVDAVAATRADATARAHAALGPGLVYASHVYSPHFLVGQATMAWEIWEALGRAPESVVVPVGHGLLALALDAGFRSLETAGRIERVPRLFAIQARACAPIYEAFQRGAIDVPPVPGGETAADGVRVADAPRGGQVLAAVRRSGGAVVSVDEDEIARAMALLANQGWFVEPSSAVAVAGILKLDRVLAPGEPVVVPLTGTALKL